ncbi:MAG: hypothetical protein AAB263_15935 [Planctomycetota bacterium]
MRIDQLVKSYQYNQATRSTKTTNDATSEAVSGAKRANQARLSDAAKGYTQATKVRDGTTKVKDQVSKASDTIDQALKPGISAEDKRKLQLELTKELDAIDEGVKEQKNALADKTLTNKIYDVKRATISEPEELGTKASDTISSLKDLRKIDLSTASEGQLREAAKVLAAAKEKTTTDNDLANKQVERISGRVEDLTTVQQTLEGSNRTTKEQRELQVVKQQQSASLIPGSLYNSLF